MGSPYVGSPVFRLESSSGIQGSRWVSSLVEGGVGRTRPVEGVRHVDRSPSSPMFFGSRVVSETVPRPSLCDNGPEYVVVPSLWSQTDWVGLQLPVLNTDPLHYPISVGVLVNKTQRAPGQTSDVPGNLPSGRSPTLVGEHGSDPSGSPWWEVLSSPRRTSPWTVPRSLPFRDKRRDG